MRKLLENSCGVAFIEGVLALVLLLSIVSGFWALHSLNDMRRNIAATAFSILAGPNFTPFTADQAGNIAQWGQSGAVGLDPVTGIDPITGTQLAPSLEQQMITQLNAGSKLFNMSISPRCQVGIGYLNIFVPGGVSTPPPNTWGNCCESVSSALRTLHPATLDSPITQLGTDMQVRADQYVNSQVGLRVNPQETLVLLDADALPQFGSSTGTTPTPIYFQWAPFLVWGCEGDISLLFGLVPFNTFRWTGIVVPKR